MRVLGLAPLLPPTPPSDLSRSRGGDNYPETWGNHRRWQKHLKVNRILARGDGFLDVYQRLDLPVIDDRDFTLHVTWGDDAGVGWMRFATANERGPAPHAGVVRVSQHEGSWRLEPLEGGAATHAVYRFYLDL